MGGRAGDGEFAGDDAADIRLHGAQRLDRAGDRAECRKTSVADLRAAQRGTDIVLRGNRVFRYRGSPDVTLNLSIVGSAGPCYFFCQVGPGAWVKVLLRAQIQARGL